MSGKYTDRIRMNVYITTSRKHLAYAYVAIYSLFENNAEEEIYLYIISEDLQESDLQNERAAADQFGHHIIIISFDDEMARGYTASSDEKHWPMATMSCYWLFHTLLPEDVDRIIAIESDTVTIGSLHDIYYADMGDAYMACPGPEHKPKSHDSFISKLGGQVVTFVLSVYDVKKIREDFKLEDILNTDAIVRKAAGHSQMEFTFGILFKGHIKYIAGKDSCLDENREYVRNLGMPYLLETEKTCKLIHFSSYEDGAKPWNPAELMPGYYYWWKYAKKSPYFRLYLEEQGERFQKKEEDRQKLQKNISYRNIITAAFLIFLILVMSVIGIMTANVWYCLGLAALAGVSVVFVLAVRKLAAICLKG